MERLPLVQEVIAVWFKNHQASHKCAPETNFSGLFSNESKKKSAKPYLKLGLPKALGAKNIGSET